MTNELPLIGPAGREIRSPSSPHPCVLDVWLLDLPSAHVAWHWYQLSLVHLRAGPDLPPPIRRSPEMAYEIMLLALDPDHVPQPDAPYSWRCLFPPNVAEQFGALDDDGARSVTRQIAARLVAGQLPVEPQGILGAQDVWVAMVADLVATQTKHAHL